jgi:hypothetical protein
MQARPISFQLIPWEDSVTAAHTMYSHAHPPGAIEEVIDGVPRKLKGKPGPRGLNVWDCSSR